MIILPRKYGKPPYTIAVIHGGPGALGDMKPIAEELSSDYGVLEPLQTAMSVNGQVEELKSQLEEHASLPVTLIGWSWGAWLSFIVAVKYPQLVNKLILVSSGPFEEKYAPEVMKTRLSRLSEDEQKEFQDLIKELSKPNSNESLKELCSLLCKTDSYASLNSEDDLLEIQQEIFQKVWKDADALRRSGELLRHEKQIQCRVVAIHGDYDPHPIAGVKEPLSNIVKDFHFIKLERCGHKPWNEKYAKREFYRILREEL